MPQSAHADPHAVFYTAIGQRQLFLNFLAALDQADYVEPATGTFSREELLKQRSAAILAQFKELGLPVTEAYIGRQDPALQATNTNLSAVVTRPVTLEGSDQFSAELLFNHAREVARRAGTAALLAEVFCEQALGRDGCGNTTSDIANRDRGFVTDPVEFASFPITNGAVANLTSGDAQAQGELQKTLADSRNGFEPGYTSDPYLAAFRKNLQEAGNTAGQKALNDRVVQTLAALYPLPVDPTTYDGLEFGDDGGIRLASATFDSRGGTPSALAAAAPSVGDPAFADWYLAKMSRLLHMPSALRDSAATGAKTIGAILETAEDQGEYADVTLIAHAKPPAECGNPTGFCPPPKNSPNPDDLSALPTVRVPVVGKTSQIQTAIQALSDLNTNLASVGSPYRLQDPIGNVPLLNPPKSAVKGIQDTAGEVLATTTTSSGTDGEELRQMFGPAPYFGVNEIVPQGEAALRQFLIAIKGSPGCGCNISAVGNAFGAQLITKVNGFSR